MSRLGPVKEEFGSSCYEARLEAVHDRYMTSFFRHFNAGHRKRLFPVWLKAPGGQMFYWGELPPFSGQEPVDELVVNVWVGISRNRHSLRCEPSAVPS